ncbi:GNAT family N-acetyltransferase [Erwiniaceae bacterium BAC15a-03b]|uniref:GNAT family N-acetyltransferase n=1 Tax=Winslowiella arboricola TaxID=2978220 RepID=A0A9J6PNC1_9GAMM|nr:GNAT family N-acetyltransferase [Winslowiella arboricola]MCU5771199.1 GNAT family N-acetyltransferase [Winslowiella arboricola]MCU5776164.1 GNAT family N-acetyltransferase [Winslowiella arboricola]
MPETDAAITVLPASAEMLTSLSELDYGFRVTKEFVAVFDRPVSQNLKRVEAYEKHYFNDPQQFSTYIDSTDSALFIAQRQQQWVGYLAVSRNWNGLALVEDIAVDRHARQLGCGRALMDAAVQWTREKNLSGLVLETQSNNVPACLFYEQYGFELAGIDRALYRALNPQRSETALFWYLWLNL